jgi:hypothetical protein
LPRQGYSELRQKGIDTLRKYASLIAFDDHETLGLEYSFQVPIDGTWDNGTVSRRVPAVLCARRTPVTSHWSSWTSRLCRRWHATWAASSRPTR